MYDKIAVALDGSTTARRAIGPARRFARAFGASLQLVTVAEGVDGEANARAYLAAGREHAGSDVESVVLKGPDPASTLGRFDADNPRTLVCMTTRGRGALRRALIGSTALSVVEHSPFAVALIGPGCTLGAELPLSTVITCLDGTREAEAILPWASGWCEHTDAELLLVHVVYPYTPPGSEALPVGEELRAVHYLEGVRAELRATHPTVKKLTIQHSDPTVALREAALGHPHGVYAVSTSHPSRLGDLLTGSTAADIVRTAQIPVLIASHD